jgi:hypothetical protein
MAIDRALWVETFDRSQFPTFPCPRCERGRVSLDKDTLKIEEPPFSSLAHSHEGWEPDWTDERFSARLRCSEAGCGEIVIVSGDTRVVDSYDDEYGWGMISVLRPKTMFPAPPLIRIPAETPDEVRSRIKAAFSLFWVDFGSAANSLRMSVEHLLDHLKVPRTSINAKTGQTVDLNLNGRIQFFEKNSPDHGTTFHALRHIGNLGSHGAPLTLEVLLDAFEIYEDALAEIIGGRKAYLDALKQKIIANKGKY